MSQKLNTIIIQPPLVQLNTPYPSGAYLLSFFKNLYSEKNIDGTVSWFDFSNDFFHAVFSKSGISKIFDFTRDKALKLADEYESNGDDNTAFQLRRFVSSRELWSDWIEKIIAIVCPSERSGREYVHEFIRSAHVPRGARVENYLSNLSRDVTADDSQILASLSLADLADYITLVYDNNFALIRYAEHLASSTASFKDCENGLHGRALNDFYKDIILNKIKVDRSEPVLFCISIPFPGCFEAALFTAKVLREEFSDCIISFGGGYVNTELREVNEEKLFDYCDCISYDKGYGSYVELINALENAVEKIPLKEKIFNGQKYFGITYKFLSKQTSHSKPGAVQLIRPLTISDDESRFAEISKLEKELVRKTTPDYSTVNFSKYPRLADDVNPMHRIWNDGSWLKAFIAHGCYWHRCAFCDTTLDYVKNYCMTDVDNLYKKLSEQAAITGVNGIHFVDEACPPAALKKFALKNLSRGTGSDTDKEKDSDCLQSSFVMSADLTFWGNIRFEKSFDRDAADLLSRGGMTAVSAGIEIATGDGLTDVNKGTDMKNIISACCAFKEAGILIHSYMIFGFYKQSEQDLINSMETLRQMFEAGLLDSAFWHKFTLTKHSTVYAEYEKGLHPDLKILPRNKDAFAENDLHFEGEEKSEKYSSGLNAALEFWMHGEKLNKSVETYFDFKMPRPTIAKDYVEKLIALYEKERDEKFAKLPGSVSDGGTSSDANSRCDEKFVWLAGEPIVLKSNGGAQLSWSYMGELLYADVEQKKAREVSEYLKGISVSKFDFCEDKSAFDGKRVVDVIGKKLFMELRGKGLCKI